MATQDPDQTQPKQWVEEGNTEAILGLSVRIRVLEGSVGYGNTQIEDMRSKLSSMTASSHRIEAAFAAYEPYLKESLESQKFWSAVRDDCIKHVSKSALWAVILGFAAAIYYAAKQAAKEWFSGS